MVLGRDIEINEERLLFHSFFLKNDKDQSVEVKTVEGVNFVEVEKHLLVGESVFISPERQQHLNLGRFSEEEEQAT